MAVDYLENILVATDGFAAAAGRAGLTHHYRAISGKARIFASDEAAIRWQPKLSSSILRRVKYDKFKHPMIHLFYPNHL